MAEPVTFTPRQLARAKAREARAGRSAAPPQHERPGTRGECVAAPRPCPYVGCRHHLFLEVTPAGGLHLRFGEAVEALAEMQVSCSLDSADGGSLGLARAARHLRLTEQAARLIQNGALARLSRLRPIAELAEDDDDGCRPLRVPRSVARDP